MPTRAERRRLERERKRAQTEVGAKPVVARAKPAAAVDPSRRIGYVVAGLNAFAAGLQLALPLSGIQQNLLLGAAAWVCVIGALCVAVWFAITHRPLRVLAVASVALLVGSLAGGQILRRHRLLDPLRPPVFTVATRQVDRPQTATGFEEYKARHTHVLAIRNPNTRPYTRLQMKLQWPEDVVSIAPEMPAGFGRLAAEPLFAPGPDVASVFDDDEIGPASAPDSTGVWRLAVNGMAAHERFGMLVRTVDNRTSAYRQRLAGPEAREIGRNGRLLPDGRVLMTYLEVKYEFVLGEDAPPQSGIFRMGLGVDQQRTVELAAIDGIGQKLCLIQNKGVRTKTMDVPSSSVEYLADPAADCVFPPIAFQTFKTPPQR